MISPWTRLEIEKLSGVNHPPDTVLAVTKSVLIAGS